MPLKVKIQDPLKFCAGAHEDVFNWKDRYETIGAYNGWDDAALRKFFIPISTALLGIGTKYKQSRAQRNYIWRNSKKAIICSLRRENFDHVCKERMKAVSHIITIS